ncbi:hypothetical protein [Paenibacillus radicis (ex Gao et al. 2016)]|uniref:Uncharacterized protein n=1 Tax=Paenibacillus radicis (ex Gao et al. 2016) TaxID=1737354 RepID=A0A917HR74_9BACL|nr:hypothetical protein [Paenibacillus radicis (ex Gao et al. 2016)]GGG87986.1 hypothetical protein GCM10010918_53000 [Paenibacillus radicis (ex Gao et al. 2016)]
MRDWITAYVAEYQKKDEDTALDLYKAGYELQHQKEFTQLILSTYLEYDLTLPSIVSKIYKGYAFSQMFLLGLIGDEPKEGGK